MASLADGVLNKLLEPDIASDEEIPQGTADDMDMLKDPRPNAQGVSHFLDIIPNVTHPIDLVWAKELLTITDGTTGKARQNIEDLDGPIGMKSSMPKACSMQLAIFKPPGGDRYTAVEHYHMPAKADVKQLQRICHGQIKVVD